MKVRIQCSAYDPTENFAIEVDEDNGGTLEIWDWPGARAGDDGGLRRSVESGVVSAWCDRIRRLRVLAVSWTDRITDLKSYDVTIDEGATRARYFWSGKAPRGWGGLSRVVKQIEAVARGDDV